jgi:hypothetical protein
MGDDRLPVHLTIGAAIRQAAASGVTITVVQKGDAGGGTVALKINMLDRLFSLYTQVRVDEDLVWAIYADCRKTDEAKVDAMIADLCRYDPDLWVLEIEDRHGRLWLDGKVLP